LPASDGRGSDGHHAERGRLVPKRGRLVRPGRRFAHIGPGPLLAIAHGTAAAVRLPGVPGRSGAGVGGRAQGPIAPRDESVSAARGRDRQQAEGQRRNPDGGSTTHRAVSSPRATSPRRGSRPSHQRGGTSRNRLPEGLSSPMSAGLNRQGVAPHRSTVLASCLLIVSRPAAGVGRRTASSEPARSGH
jgi:hypothetical protein